MFVCEYSWLILLLSEKVYESVCVAVTVVVALVLLVLLAMFVVVVQAETETEAELAEQMTRPKAIE